VPKWASVGTFYLYLGMKNLLTFIGLIMFGITGYAQDTIKNVEAGVRVDKIEPIYDIAPEFPGGMEALYKFISQKIIYPIDAVEAETQGRVLVRFVVDKEGNVKDAKIQKGVSQSIDQEALRVVKSMPKWKPGILDNKPVNVYYDLPIAFKLQ
jgi:TonB family protein